MVEKLLSDTEEKKKPSGTAASVSASGSTGVEEKKKPTAVEETIPNSNQEKDEEALKKVESSNFYCIFKILHGKK